MQHTRESLHETTSHGRKTFPYAIYHARIPEWLAGFPLHWHDEFEIILVTYGRGEFSVGKTCYLCNKDDIILIPPGAIHSIARNGYEYVEYFNILFSLSLLEENPDSLCHRRYLSRLAADARLRAYHLPRNTPLNRRLFPLVSDLVEHRRETEGYELMIKARLFEIMHDIRDEIAEPSRSGKSQAGRLRSVLSFVAAHFPERISVEAAAEACALSPSRFMKVFREETGMSFVQYLNDYRLEAAAEQLSAGNSSVTEAAVQNGFDNISYFIRKFQEKFGCTPNSFRRRKAR